MKKFWISLGTAVLLFILVVVATLCVMASVHGHSVPTEFYNWFPALEKTVETEDASKDEDIVIEDETQTEDVTEEGTQTEETPSEETGEEETEEQTETEGTESGDETQTE